MGKATDDLFRLGLVVKGVDSVFEMVGGVLVGMHFRVARYLAVLSGHEIFQHHQVLAGRLDRLSQTVTTHGSPGAAAYLFVHGLAKVILIAAIVAGKRWGYLGFFVVLSFFALVEIIRAFTAREVVTGVFGVFDMIVVLLIYKEYRVRFVNPKPHQEP